MNRSDIHTPTTSINNKQTTIDSPMMYYTKPFVFSEDDLIHQIIELYIFSISFYAYP